MREERAEAAGGCGCTAEPRMQQVVTLHLRESGCGSFVRSISEMGFSGVASSWVPCPLLCGRRFMRGKMPNAASRRMRYFREATATAAAPPNPPRFVITVDGPGRCRLSRIEICPLSLLSIPPARRADKLRWRFSLPIPNQRNNVADAKDSAATWPLGRSPANTLCLSINQSDVMLASAVWTQCSGVPRSDSVREWKENPEAGRERATELRRRLRRPSL